MSTATSWLTGFRQNPHARLYALALLVGIVVAYGAIGFRLLIDALQLGFMGFGGEAVFTGAQQQPRWRIALAPVVGGLAVGLMLRFFTKDQRPQGIADVVAANALDNARMPLRDGLAAAAISATSIGAGASTGREGPIVHLGGTIAAWLAERLGLNPALSRTLLACGVASAVAASFNAPIAGVFFALEVILGHYALHAFAPIVMASVMGTIVSRIHLGNYPAFIIPEYAIVSAWEFPAFALLGVVCAIVAIIFMRSIFFAEDQFKARIPLPRWLHPMIGGVLIGGIAIYFPQILGVGYEATDGALQESFVLWMLLALLAIKVAATSISIGAGFGGGVFSPSLFVGAMTGSAFGIVAAMVFPDLAASHGLYAIVGMGAVAGAVLGAPISTFLIVFELVGDYQLTIAIMVATATASLITQQFYPASFFRMQLQRRGLNLQSGRAGHLLRTMHVSDFVSHDFRTVGADETLAQVRVKMALSPHGTLLIQSEGGAFLGQINAQDIEGLSVDEEINEETSADALLRGAPQTIYQNDTLEQALALMDVTDDDHVAVLNNDEERSIVGILHHRDALRAYNRALVEERKEERGEQ